MGAGHSDKATKANGGGRDSTREEESCGAMSENRSASE